MTIRCISLNEVERGQLPFWIIIELLFKLFGNDMCECERGVDAAVPLVQNLANRHRRVIVEKSEAVLDAVSVGGSGSICRFLKLPLVLVCMYTT